MSAIPLSLTNPTVQSYIVHSAILALKLLSVGTLTSLVRLTKGVFSNPEDAKTLRGKVKFDDPTVERTRRAHLNDLENIPAFWVLGLLYVTTGPVAAWATLLFRVYTVCRIVHTIVYAVIPFPQPTRAIAYMIPYLINWYMGIQVVMHYITAVALYATVKTARALSREITKYINNKTTNMVPVTIMEPAVRSYIVYSGILALKVLGMAILTAKQRYSRKVFANEEDAKAVKGIVKLDDPEVERVRRAHLNDLENIPAFWILGGLYLTTGPSAELATMLFRVYTAGRILHTIVYAVKPLPQPARGIAFGIPNLIVWYMGIKVVIHYISDL